MRRFIYLWYAAVFALTLPVAKAQSLPPYAANVRALTAVVGEAQVERLANGFAVVAPDDAPNVIDRLHNELFTRILCLYAPRGDDQDGPSGLVPAIYLHFNDTDTVSAQRGVRLFARLIGLYTEHLKRTPIFGHHHDDAHIYLTASKSKTLNDAGGETRDNCVYIYDTGTPRTDLEWTRTFAHEWGHLTLPAARGYSSPENDAAGYLGERLFMKWLGESKALKTDDGTSAADLELYRKRQIEPLIMGYLKNGPRDPQLYTMDGEAMDRYIGAILCCDDALGSAVVADALYSVGDTKPRSFFAALRENLRKKPVTPTMSCWLPAKSGWQRAITGKVSEKP